MPDTLTIPEQVTVSGETLYGAIRDVAEVREYVLNTLTDYTDTRLTEQLFGVVEALSKPLGGLYVVGGASDGELMPLAAQFRRESETAVAERLETIACSVRLDVKGDG